MIQRIKSTLFLILTALLLNACSSSVRVDTSLQQKMSPKERYEKVMGVRELEESGKIALISRVNSSRYSVSSLYHYKDKAFSLEFTGPMGMRYARLDVQKNGSTYLDVRGRSISGSSARELLKRQFNLDVPVEDLHRIIVGYPQGELTYDDRGNVVSAIYDGVYEVHYQNYKTFGEGIPLPTSIEVNTSLARVVLKVNSVSRLK